MSKIFYDHLILIEDLFEEIDQIEGTEPDKAELKKTLDDIVHHRIFSKILELLPEVHHTEFLERFHAAPYALDHLEYLEEKTDQDITSELVLVAVTLKKELKNEIHKYKPKHHHKHAKNS